MTLIKNTDYILLKSPSIFLDDTSLKGSFIVFTLKYFVRILSNSAQVIRKCLTVKSSLQGMQNGACSFFKI